VASSTSADAATNVNTDISAEPTVLQIQANGNHLEEEAIDIDGMLLGELDLEELSLSGVQAAVPPAVPDSTASTTTVMTATATAITAAVMAATAPATATMAATTKTKPRPPKGLKRQRA
jgi:hypothetical protein